MATGRFCYWNIHSSTTGTNVNIPEPLHPTAFFLSLVLKVFVGMENAALPAHGVDIHISSPCVPAVDLHQ